MLKGYSNIILAVLSLLYCNLVFSEENKTLNQQAYELLQKGQYLASFQLAHQAEIQAKENNPVELARAYSNKASNLFYLGENMRALKLYNKALKISVAENDFNGRLRVLNNIAGIYQQLKNFKEGHIYRQKHLQISLNHSDREDRLISYIGMAGSFLHLDDFDQAIESLQKARNIQNDLKSDFLEIYLINVETTLYQKQKKFDQAIALQARSLEVATRLGFEGAAVSAVVITAELYSKIDKCEKAISVSEEYLPEVIKLKLVAKQIRLNRLISNCLEKLGSYKKALEYTKEANELSFTVNGEKIQSLAAVTKIERQVKETEFKLQESQKDQEILSLKIKQQDQNLLIWLATVTTIFSFLFILYFRITHSREIRRQQKLNQQLQELDYVKDRVLTNTSHELRTPLNGIIGLSEILIHDDQNKFSESTMDSIKLIKKSGEQLALVVNDILEMSKLKTSNVTIVNSQFELSELISDVVQVCLPSAVKKNIEIIYSNLAAQVITQDRSRLQQILFNLIGNAVKFTHEGRIEISASVTDHKLTIITKDSGIGIPADRQDRIFEGFEQVDIGDSRSESGSGLGLAISRGLAEALGGELTLTSELGKGSEFKLLLPC